MANWMTALALIYVAIASQAIAQTQDTLIGTWKLISSKDTTETGEVKDPLAGILQAFSPTRLTAE